MSLAISKMKVSVALNKTKLSKSGNNKHMGFKYFTLDDFLPTLTDLMVKEEIGDMVTIEFNEHSQRYEICLYLIKGEEQQRYAMPFNEYETPESKGGNKTMQDVQYIGALKSYYRRYLYVDAFGIADGEVVDGMNNNELAPKKKETQQHSSLGNLNEEEATRKAIELGKANLIKALDKAENLAYKDETIKNVCALYEVKTWEDITFNSTDEYNKLTSNVKRELQTIKDLEMAGI